MSSCVAAVQKKGAVQRLTFSERWFRDGLLECGLGGSSVSVEADVSMSAEALSRFRAAGSEVKWTALFVKAAALALAQNPNLNRLVARNTSWHPDSIDICLSVSSDRALTPVIIVENCAPRNIEWLALEIARLTPIAKENDQKMVSVLNRWGFLGFTQSMRRKLIRFLLGRLWYRRKVSGTFQVSCLPAIDIFTPLRFNTAAVLGVGQVKERPYIANGVLTVKKTVFLTCCFDHGVWNGANASTFLNTVKTILEQGHYASGQEEILR